MEGVRGKKGEIFGKRKHNGCFDFAIKMPVFLFKAGFSRQMWCVVAKICFDLVKCDYFELPRHFKRESISAGLRNLKTDRAHEGRETRKKECDL